MITLHSMPGMVKDFLDPNNQTVESQQATKEQFFVVRETNQNLQSFDSKHATRSSKGES